MEEIKPEVILAIVWTLDFSGTSLVLQIASVERSWHVKAEQIGIEGRFEEQDKDRRGATDTCFVFKQNECDVISWN